MPVWICVACGVEHPESDAPPATCAICTDERQYVPRSGQAWTSLEQLTADGYRVRISNVEPDLFGVTSTPEVGIGQRSLVVRTPAGNLLWDPVGFVDEIAARQVRELGPVAAIVAGLLAANPVAATTRMVTVCADTGTGGLRQAIAATTSSDTVDMTALTCSKLTLTAGETLHGNGHKVGGLTGYDVVNIAVDNFKVVGTKGSVIKL